MNLDIREIDVQLRSETIVGKTRKLKASWTLNSLKTLTLTTQLTKELTSMLSEYISMEIDLEILDMLIENEFHRNWSAKVGLMTME